MADGGDSLHRAVLPPQTVALGTAYDARTDMTIGPGRAWTNAVLRKAGNTLETKVDILNTTFLASKEYSKAVHDIGVSLELKASFCGGLVDVSGSASYIAKANFASNTYRASILFDLKTSTLSVESELVSNEEERRAMNKSLLNDGRVTHVVTEVCVCSVCV